jgi:hypothetical protein
MVSHIYCFVIFTLKMYTMALIVATTTPGTTTAPAGEKQTFFYL